MRIFSSILILLLLGMPASSFADKPPASEKASDFTLTNLAGGNSSLSDYDGKVRLVSFWATWCAPCKKEMKHLNTMQAELGEKGLQVISISTDTAKDQAKVKAIIKQMKYTPVVLLDQDTTVVNQYNPKKDMPYTFIVGKDGMVYHRKKGFTEGDEVKLKKWVEELL